MTLPLVRKKYVPRLSRHHGVCETNYGRLLRLLPELDEEGLDYQFRVNDKLSYRMLLTRCSRYTTELRLCQLGEGPDYLSPEFRVRLYHDARMAEVVAFQNVSLAKGSYAYPNEAMYLPNEKEMLNLFLAEWLGFCLQAKPATS